MNFKKLLVGAMVTLAIATQAQALTIDISGELADGAAFNVLPLVNNPDAGAVISIDFSITYSTDFDAGYIDRNGWGNEMLIQLIHIPTNTAIQIGTVGLSGGCSGFGVDCDPGGDLAFPGANGTFTASGSVTGDAFTGMSLVDLIADGSGDWEILIAASYDNPSIAGPEGIFLADSTLTISQVPLPAGVWLLLSALGGLGLTRRR